MSERHLSSMFDRADADDRTEGKLAYPRYNELMNRIADKYGVDLPRVVAGFVSLSPNNDYIGNLRSLISVLDGFRDGVPVSQITVSTYKHCRDRAFAYITGQAQFVTATTGLKVLSFYHNVLNPLDHRWVTVDGHVVATYRNKPNWTMKQAIIRRKREYHEIASSIKRLAFREFLIPQEYQATLWFARKRVLRIKYDAQRDLFYPGDVWRTSQRLDDIRPFKRTYPQQG